MSKEKCYFHPEWPAEEKVCSSCKRPFCKACIDKKTGICFACRAINWSKGGEQSERLKIDIIKIKERESTEKNFLQNSTYSIPEIWIGNLDKLEFFPFLSTQYFSLPRSEEEVKIYYTNPRHNQVNSIWSIGEKENSKIIEEPALLFSAANVKYFTGLIGKIIKFILLFLLPLAILWRLEDLLFQFLRNSPAINWLYLIGIVASLIFVYLFGTLFIKRIHPNLWSPSLTRIVGEVEENLLLSEEPAGYLNWSVRKKIPWRGEQIIIGWQIFLRVITDGKKRRVLIEGPGEKPQEIPKKGKDKYIFTGRELYNVLVCNLNEKKHSVLKE